MPLRFLFDEDTRDKGLLDAVDRHNANHPAEFLDVIRVGDSGGPESGTQDPELVEWSGRQNGAG